MGSNPPIRRRQTRGEVRKQKAMPIGPYLFYLYVVQEVLLLEEMVAYDIGMDLLKYDCTLEPDPDRYTPLRSDPWPSPITQRSNRKPSDQPESSQSRDIRDEEIGLNEEELNDMANSFNNAIRWMEIAKTNYEHMGDIVADVCKALGNVDIRDIDSALTRVAQK